MADLVGCRLVVTTEVADGRRLAEALAKQLTGGDRVKARFLHRDFFEMEPTWTIWLVANPRPEDRHRDLYDRLKEELSGILNWAVKGCLDYQSDESRDPGSSP